MSILADFNNIVVWMVSAYPLISEPLGIIPSAQITIGITFTFHSFVVLKSSLSICLSFHFLWCSFCGLPRWQSPWFNQFSFFLLTIMRSGLLAGIRWSIWISKSQRILCVSFSSTDYGLCIYYLVVWSNSICTIPSGWLFPLSYVLSCTFLC